MDERNIKILGKQLFNIIPHPNPDNLKPINNIPPSVKEYFDLIPKEEVERRIKFARTKGPRSEIIGIFEGMIWMSDDFDEPLEEMKEYM